MPSALTDSTTRTMSRGGNDKGGRRNTISVGAENVHANKKSSSSSSNPSGEGKSRGQNDASATAKEVRWSVPNGHSTAISGSMLDTTVASVPMSPSQRAKDRFVDVASGRKDVVMNYHFEGTPFSQKKKRRKHYSHGNDHQHHHKQLNTSSMTSSSTVAEAAQNAMENTFHLGIDTTAEIRNMNAIAAGEESETFDPLNDSIFTLGSKSSMASNASSAGSSTASSIIDPLNCTTMSDTHELSTSNFLQNVKMRNVLAERAQALYGKSMSLVEKDKNKNHDGGKGNTKQRAKGGEIVGTKCTGNAAPLDILGEDTMTLPDLTLNLSGLLSGVEAPSDQFRRRSIAQPLNNHQQSVDSDSDDMLEFTSRQRSSTPQKHRDSGVNKVRSLERNGECRNDEMNNTDVSKSIEGQEGKILCVASKASLTNERMETSFSDSTASLDDIDNLLGNDEENIADAESEHNINIVPAETERLPSESTPVAPYSLKKSISSSLCPSPSFLSGKTQRGSGILSLRKSLGGDVSKIRKLTASLRKENEEKRRVSLPALVMTVQQHQRASVDRSALDVEHRMNEPTHDELRKSPLKNQPSSPTRENEHSVPPSPKMMLSPARSIATQKSPSRSPSGKSPVVAAIDSPARNTRSATKKSPISPLVNSPAQKKRASAKKSPSRKKSPSSNSSSVNVDSPARNTRFGTRKSDSPKHLSPARSLFNSPSDIDVVRDIDSNFGSLAESIQTSVRNGPFSGRKRINRTNKNDESAPSQKRMSMSPESSELTMTSLSMNYPFLSLSPNLRIDPAPSKEYHNTDSTILIENGTQTLIFNELMHDIENGIAAESMKDSLVRNEKECTPRDEINFVSRQSRSMRRSADTADLMGILAGDAMLDGTSPKASAALDKENKSPHTPSAAWSKPSKTPKSILSSAKQRSSKPKRHVEFGSPVFAEYNIDSPSMSMTPMHPEFIRERNQMPEEEHTTELESGLERLINMGNDNSIMMDPIDEIGDSTADSSQNETTFPGAERTEELETNILNLVDNRADESAFSLPSFSSVSSSTSRRDNESSTNGSEQDTSQDSSMSIVEQTQTMNIASFIGKCNDKRASIGFVVDREETQTMELEGNFSFLVDKRDDISATLAGEETQTMQLEGTLASLLEDLPGRNTDHDVTLPSLSLTSPHRMENRDIQTHEELRSINIEGTIESLLETVPEDGSSNTTAYTNAASLDSYREVLLNVANKRSIHREDDTISELGMNTACHDLRHDPSDTAIPREDVNLIRMTTASQEQRSEGKDAAPVDLTLDEIVNVRDIDWDQLVESHSDILLEALELVSKNNTCPSIQVESDKVFASICYEIESELEDRDADSQFSAIVVSNRDLMRNLQTRLRALDDKECEDEIKFQAKLLLQSHNEAQLAAWLQWLTEVAGVYNNELLTTILLVLQKDTAVLSESSSLIDRNREQIALPLLIRSARRATKKNYERTMIEVSSCEDEVSDLEAQVEDAERQLESLQSMQERIHNVAESNHKFDNLLQDEMKYRVTADTAYFKFFSIERLHNWVLTGSSESSIGLVFRGLSMETSIHLTFAITAASVVTLRAEFGSLPRSVTSFLNVACTKQSKFHPAVSDFLNNKMVLLCNDLKNSQIANPSAISTMIHFAELRVARIESVAKELDSILARCRNSFLQPSDSRRNGYDFTVYLSTTSREDDRLHAILTIPDCYPCTPIDTKLHTNGGPFDKELILRKLKMAATPGFGAIMAAVEVLQSVNCAG